MDSMLRYKLAHDAVQLRASGTSGWRAIAAALARQGWDSALLTEGRIKGALRDWPRLKQRYGADNHLAQALGVREYTFGALDANAGGITVLPVFDGEPRLAGDWVVAGDFHLPTTDFSLAELLLRTAQELNIRKLLIVGDLCNFDAFSRYEHIVPPPAFEVEVRIAVQLMSRYATHFDDIVMVLGNHEHRLLRRSNGNLSSTMLGHILGAAQHKMRLSPYAYAVIESGGQLWRATHQRNYSRTTGRVADQLAQKHQSNILAFHEHHAAIQRDTWNRYTIVNCGGLFDDAKLAYVRLEDSTMPGMARGFVLLLDGCAHLITPYQTMTNWQALIAGLKVVRGSRIGGKGNKQP